MSYKDMMEYLKNDDIHSPNGSYHPSDALKIDTVKTYDERPVFCDNQGPCALAPIFEEGPTSELGGDRKEIKAFLLCKIFY